MPPQDSLSSHEKSDFQIQLDRARNGSEDDRAALLESFRNYLRKIAHDTISPKPQAQLSVSDLVQSAIIGANEGFDQCRAVSRQQFKAWLKRILINDIINKIRDLERYKRDIRKETPFTDSLDVSDGNETPSRKAMRDEEEERLLGAISKLPQELQDVIRMRHEQSMTFVDIGRELGKSPYATRTLWNKAIDALAKILAKTK